MLMGLTNKNKTSPSRKLKFINLYLFTFFSNWKTGRSNPCSTYLMHFWLSTSTHSRFVQSNFLPNFLDFYIQKTKSYVTCKSKGSIEYDHFFSSIQNKYYLHCSVIWPCDHDFFLSIWAVKYRWKWKDSKQAQKGREGCKKRPYY